MDESNGEERNAAAGRNGANPRNDAYMLVGLGNVYMQRNQIAEARLTFAQVLENFPDTEPAQIARQTLEKIGRESI